MRAFHHGHPVRRLALTAVVLALLAGMLSATQPPAPRLAPVADAVTAEIAAKGSATFVVEFGDRPNLAPATAIGDWAERGQFVVDALRRTAERAQRSTVDELGGHGAAFTSYWVNNTIIVRGGDGAALSAVRAKPEVARVSAPVTVQVPTPVAAEAAASGVTWGVADTGADRVWSELAVRGEGVVVANLDTGVQFDHPALRASYRGRAADGSVSHDYNWFDPTGRCPAGTPCDNNGHGTHTMGTIVGDGGPDERIGMAPGARWIAAKGCATGNCSTQSLTAAGQWLLAPTDRNGQNPNPALRPNVINNSWGGGTNWYQPIVDAWRAAGIIPVFSSGNDGPGCGTVGYPGALDNVIAVGAHDENGAIADFSSRGPSEDGHAKPDVSAPGVAVRSSVPGSAYDVYNGTSMAAPHVTGAVALLLSRSAALGFDDVTALLDDTAHDVDDTTCGGDTDDNNVWGEGTLDAYAAVLGAPAADAGRISGVVTDASSGDPVADATVAVGDRVTRTAADGRYAVLVDAGARELAVTAFGYERTVEQVDVPAGAVTTVDIGLSATPTQLVTGTVTDGGGYGWAIYARAQVVGQPRTRVYTDPVTGRWQARLPEGEHLLAFDSPMYGYGVVERRVTVTAGGAPVDVALRPGCPAFGYVPSGAGCGYFTNRGAVVGHVTSTVDGTALDGATVSVGAGRPDVWEKVTTQPTGADPALADGFYAVSAEPGRARLTVRLGGYDTATVPVDVVRGQVLRADIKIDAGRITVSVEGLDRTLAFGEKADGKITLTNTGTADATVKLAERPRMDDSSAASTGVTRVPIEPRTSRFDPIRTAGSPDVAGLAPATSPVAVPPADAGEVALLPSAAGPGWEQVADLPSGLTETVSVAVDGMAYVVGGGYAINPDGISGIADSYYVYAHDPVTGGWSQKRRMNFGRMAPAAAAIDGLIYVAGGYDVDTVSAVSEEGQPARDYLLSPGLEVYDPVTDKWDLRAGPPTVYQYVAGAALDGQFYVVGGCDVSCARGSTDVFRYDPATQRWRTLAPYPIPVYDTRCGALAGAVYCAGGRDATGAATARAFRYDPARDVWTEVAPLPVGMYASASTVANGLLVMSGGLVTVDGAAYATNEGYAYDANTDTWSALPAAPRISFGTSAACGLYRFGGITYDDERGWQVAATTERLPGMDACGDGGDVDWLSLDRAEVTLAPGATTTVAVRMDSTVLTAPGTARGAVSVVESTPDQVSPVPVTMAVTESAGAGRLAITAGAVGRCGAAATPLAGATVTVKTPARTRVVRAGTDGTAVVWAMPAEGTAMVTVSAPGHQPAVAPRLRVRPGQATPVSLTPKQVVACTTVSKQTADVTVAEGRSATVDVSLGNDGTTGYDAAVVESPAQLRARPAGRGATGPSATGVTWPAPARGTALPAGWYRTATDYPNTGQDSGVQLVGCDGRTDMLFALDVIRSFVLESGAFAETPRYPDFETTGAVAVCDVHEIHVLGGGEWNWSGLPHYVYDTVNRTWRSAESVPGRRNNAAVGIWDGRIYLAGGRESGQYSATGKVSVYDTATRTWSELTTPMQAPTMFAGFAQQGHHLYVAGGQSGWNTGRLATTQRLNMITGAWEVGPDLPAPRSHHAVAATSAALYAIGGQVDDADHPITDRVDRLAAPDWSVGWQGQAPLPRPVMRAGAGCTESLTGGEIWVAGGMTASSPRTVSDAVWFRPVAGERCATVAGDVPWLSVSASTVRVDPGSPAKLRLTVDARSLRAGTYHATVLVRTDDPGAPEIRVPVTVTVRRR